MLTFLGLWSKVGSYCPPSEGPERQRNTPLSGDVSPVKTFNEPKVHYSCGDPKSGVISLRTILFRQAPYVGQVFEHRKEIDLQLLAL